LVAPKQINFVFLFHLAMFLPVFFAVKGKKTVFYVFGIVNHVVFSISLVTKTEGEG